MNKKLIWLTESDLHKIVKESVKRVLIETHVRKLYHFVSPKQLQYIFKYGFKLNDEESNYSISTQLPKFLSFSRNRNGVQGFPFMNTDYYGGGGTRHYSSQNWLLIRLEIDAEKLNYYGKVKPFDYIYHFNKEEYDDETPLTSKEEVAKMATDYPNLDFRTDCDGQDVYGQPFSQAEERLFSKLNKIPKEDSLKLITRIDVYANTASKDEAIEFYEFANWLRNKKGDFDLNFYNDIGNFNLQTNKTMPSSMWEYYYRCYKNRNNY